MHDLVHVDLVHDLVHDLQRLFLSVCSKTNYIVFVFIIKDVTQRMKSEGSVRLQHLVLCNTSNWLKKRVATAEALAL